MSLRWRIAFAFVGLCALGMGFGGVQARERTRRGTQSG